MCKGYFFMYPSSILMMSVVFIVITIQTAVRLSPISVGSFVHCWPEIGFYVISQTGLGLSRQQCDPGWSQTCSNPPGASGTLGLDVCVTLPGVQLHLHFQDCPALLRVSVSLPHFCHKLSLPPICPFIIGLFFQHSILSSLCLL